MSEDRAFILLKAQFYGIMRPASSAEPSITRLENWWFQYKDTLHRPSNLTWKHLPRFKQALNLEATQKNQAVQRFVHEYVYESFRRMHQLFSVVSRVSVGQLQPYEANDILPT